MKVTRHRVILTIVLLGGIIFGVSNAVTYAKYDKAWITELFAKKQDKNRQKRFTVDDGRSVEFNGYTLDIISETYDIDSKSCIVSMTVTSDNRAIQYDNDRFNIRFGSGGEMNHAISFKDCEMYDFEVSASKGDKSGERESKGETGNVEDIENKIEIKVYFKYLFEEDYAKINIHDFADAKEEEHDYFDDAYIVKEITLSYGDCGRKFDCENGTEAHCNPFGIQFEGNRRIDELSHLRFIMKDGSELVLVDTKELKACGYYASSGDSYGMIEYTFSYLIDLRNVEKIVIDKIEY